MAEPEPVAEPEAVAEPVAVAEPEPEAEPEPVAEPEPEAESEPEAEPEPEPEAKPVAVAKPVAYVLIFHDVSSLVATCKFSNKCGSYSCCIIDHKIVNGPICKSTRIFISVLCPEYVTTYICLTTFPDTVIFMEHK